jgi:hypothetical protein
MSTSSSCPGGTFQAGSPPNWPCSGGNDIQSCVTNGGTPPPAGSGPLPGLDDTQSAHGWAIIGEVQKENLGKQGCLAAFATALVESSVLVYANNAVAESLSYPYDKIGSDHDSIGIFQQRASIYTNIAADMDPAGSAAQFFSGMTSISGWQTMDVGTLCQEVQKSAYPDRYSEQVSAATSICAAGGLS